MLIRPDYKFNHTRLAFTNIIFLFLFFVCVCRNPDLDIPVEKVRKGTLGELFESQAGVSRGIQMTFSRKWLPFLHDERDFVRCVCCLFYCLPRFKVFSILFVSEQPALSIINNMHASFILDQQLTFYTVNLVIAGVHLSLSNSRFFTTFIFSGI